MKLVGFIKEYDNISGAISLEQLKTTLSVKRNDIKQIIAYLENGVPLLALMGYFMDVETNTPMIPMGYDTDGVWVWPSYFPYYLKKYPKTEINDEFLDYIKSKDFEFKIDKNFYIEKGKNQMKLLEMFGDVNF